MAFKVPSHLLKECFSLLLSGDKKGLPAGSETLRNYGFSDLQLFMDLESKSFVGLNFFYADMSFLVDSDRTLLYEDTQEDKTFKVEDEELGQAVTQALQARLTLAKWQVKAGWRFPTEDDIVATEG